MHQVPAENLIAVGGKVCYNSFGHDGRSVPAHVAGHLENKHYSVLEHANFSVFIEGISRGCSHEVVRHRHFSFSQRSTRYVDEASASIVLKPTYTALWEKDPSSRSEMERTVLDAFVESCRTDLTVYAGTVRLLSDWNPKKLEGRALRKWARGEARQLLPHALETRMVMTGNVRTWREFFEKRTDREADDEIRRLAWLLYMTLHTEAYNAFFMYQHDTVDGIPQLRDRA